MHFSRELFVDFYQQNLVFDDPFMAWRWKPLGPREGSLSLAEIASQAGCSSLSHFSALLRRVAGETPTDWRKRHRGR